MNVDEGHKVSCQPVSQLRIDCCRRSFVGVSSTQVQLKLVTLDVISQISSLKINTLLQNYDDLYTY